MVDADSLNKLFLSLNEEQQILLLNVCNSIQDTIIRSFELQILERNRDNPTSPYNLNIAGESVSN